MFATLLINSCLKKIIQNANGTSAVLWTGSSFVPEDNRYLSVTYSVYMCVGERVSGRQEDDFEAGNSFLLNAQSRSLAPEV